jgi:hypothetical protein
MVLKITKNFAVLYGIMLGDGCLSLVYGKKKFISIAGSLEEDKPFFENTIQPILKTLTNKQIPLKLKPSCGSLELNFINPRLFDYISSLEFPIGKKGNKLSIPKQFYNTNLVKYVVRGFFATDGSLVLTNNNGTLYPRVEANGIAKDLIQEISTFLNNKGINCKFYEAKRRVQHYENSQKQYRLQINGRENLRKFIKEIGFINPKQIERLKRYNGCTEN